MEWKRMYPESGTLRCPLCSSCFWKPASYEIHVRRHRVPPTRELWVCSLCLVTFSNKTEVKQHFRSTHPPQLEPAVVSGRLSDTETEEDLESWLFCDFCEKSFPSQRGLLNHERSLHQAQRSKALAAIKAKTRSNRWSEQEVELFKRMVQIYGLTSNKLLARKIGTKSRNQVAGFKYRFLQKHPLWRRYDYGAPAMESSSQSTSVETSSCHSSPSSVATNKALSPTTTTEIDSSDCERFVESLTQHYAQPGAQSTLLNKADKLVAMLRAPLPLHLSPSLEPVHQPTEEDERIETTTTSQHTPPIPLVLESQPVPLVSQESISFERLRLDFTDRDFANNNNNMESSLPSSVTPVLNPTHLLTETTVNTTTTTTTTLSTSQMIRSVISDIRQCVETDDPGLNLQEEQSHINTQGARGDRPMGGVNLVGEGQCMVENSQPGENDRHLEGDGPVRCEQSQRGGPLLRGGGASGPRSWRNERSGGTDSFRGEGQGRQPFGGDGSTRFDQSWDGRSNGRGSQRRGRGRRGPWRGGLNKHPLDRVEPIRGGQSRRGEQPLGGFRPGGPVYQAEGNHPDTGRRDQPEGRQTTTTNSYSVTQPRRGQDRRNGLNPNAPPFILNHHNHQSQQSSQTNRERVHTLFQSRLLHLTEMTLLNDEEWVTFCSAVDDLTKVISELCNKDHQNSNRRGNRNGQRGWRQRNAAQPNRRPYRADGRERRIKEMADIQKLYRKSPKQAMQQIKQEPPPLRCQIPCQDVQNHFEQLGSSTPNFDEPGPPPFGSWPATTDGDVMENEITQQEVKAVLKKMPHHSAPGPDYVTYTHWREVDPAAEIATKILETCRRNKRIPPSWKNSTTILIHKGDDPAIIKNWRPISLQNTVYKLYSAVIGRRLSSWAQCNNIFSRSQKGFLPCEGCLEHNFLLTSVLQDSRRKRAPVCITWLDLSNAFPSVPHGVLMEMLSRTGVGPHTRNIIKDIYTDATMCVRTANGMTAPIQCNKGVKQGCPLSPILFNFVMEPLIRAADSTTSGGYSIGNHDIRSLAYADDLCVLANSTTAMQEMLLAIQSASNWAGLSFNPRKCGTLTLSRSSRQFADTFSPKLNGELLPSLKWEDHYKYLGCKAGADHRTEATTQGNEYVRCCKLIVESGLADWQKLDAIHRFAKPGLTYILQNTLPNKSWAQRIDKQVRNMVKLAFKLPKRTISAFLHTPPHSGGLGIPCIEDEIDVHLATTAFKLLSTPDTLVKGVAYHHLGNVTEKRTRSSEATIGDMEEFLNSTPTPGEGKAGDIRSLWSVVRSSLARCDAIISLSGNRITCSGKTINWSGKKETGRALRAKLLQRHLRNLQEASDQGRTSTCVALHPSSNYWIRSGKYISFGEYRFAVKGRLNMLPTRTVLRRSGKANVNTSCPGCNQEQETLAHILNHCSRNEGLIRHRHNAILHRLAKAIPRSRGTQYLEQSVPGDPQGLKPDIVVLNDATKEAWVVDVTVPFEGEGTLEEARRGKVEKYNHLREVLAAKGYRNVTIDAFIIGSLGSWDPQNESLVRKLGISRRYMTLFRKLCCWQAISGSYGIWRAKSNR